MKPFRVVLLFAALALVSLSVPVVQAQQDAGVTPAVIATPSVTPTANVSARTVTINGQQVGEVLIGSTPVIQLTRSAGGYSPGERASIVASRLATQISRGYGWQDVTVAQQQGNRVALLIAGAPLVTVTNAEARASGVTPLQLASTWRTNTQTALRNVTVSTVAGSQEQWPDWTNAGTKIVPIVSLGTPGLRLGACQVTGPSERVDQVGAVLQLDLVFNRTATIHVFIPSTSPTKLERVQGVAVSALLQYRIFRF